MVFEATVDTVARFVLIVGLPFLVILFYLEGLVIGKILQPPAVFVTVVAISRPSPWVLGLLSVGCTVSVVAGQWTTYRSFDTESPGIFSLRRRAPSIERLLEWAVKRVGEKRFKLVDTLFTRYGGLGIFLATFLPGIRGVIAIPAGISSYPASRFLIASGLGNALYFPLLVAVAYGILQILGL